MENTTMNLLKVEDSPTLYHPLSGQLLLKNKTTKTLPAATWTLAGIPTKSIHYQISDPLLLTWWTNHGIHQLNYAQNCKDLTIMLANTLLASSHGHPDFVLMQQYSNPKNRRIREKLIKTLKKQKNPESLKHIELLKGNQTFFGHYPEGIPALSHYIATLKTLKKSSQFLIFAPHTPTQTLEEKTIPIIWKKTL
jgi:hypothetical protein